MSMPEKNAEKDLNESKESVELQEFEQSKKQKETIIFFVAHPDDEVIGAGGTIAQYAAEGKRIIVVLFTDGESSHPWQKKDIIVQQRQLETEAAAKILGVAGIHNLHFRDGSLTNDIKKPIVKLILLDILKLYKPYAVFTHSHDDVLYPDHRAVHKATMQAVDEYARHVIQQPIDVYAFNIWSLTVRKRYLPQLSIDISKEFELKKKALQCYKSQIVALIQLWPSVLIKAFLEGKRAQTRYAESFYKIR